MPSITPIPPEEYIKKNNTEVSEQSVTPLAPKKPSVTPVHSKKIEEQSNVPPPPPQPSATAPQPSPTPTAGGGSQVPPPPPGPKGQWYEITKSVYNELKRGGKYVLNQITDAGEKFFQWITEPGEVKKYSAFSCIEKYNDEMKLRELDISDDGKTARERFMKRVDDRRTELVYTVDGNVKWVFRDDNSVILNGRWECVDDAQYVIRFDDGQVVPFGDKAADIQATGRSTTTNQPQKTQSCKSLNTNCPTEKQILDGKKILKLCMKCDLIQQIQNIDFIKAILHKIQETKGLPKETSDVYTQEFKEAIEEFQARSKKPTILKKDGIIGQKTLKRIKSLEKSKSSTTLEPVVNTSSTTLEPVVNVSSTTLEPSNVTTDTKKTQPKPVQKIVINPSIYMNREIPVAGYDENL